MKIVKYKDAVKFSDSDKCIGLEYPLGDEDINFSIATILGRYQQTVFCKNDEWIYVIDGSGTLNKQNEVIEFSEGDVILINKKEIYYWDAFCTIAMPCTLAWYPLQHKLVD